MMKFFRKIAIFWDCGIAKRGGILHHKINHEFMGLLGKIFNNTRKPEGFFGKLMVSGMNGGSHAAMANWALSSVEIGQNYKILDIGCGGGANIARLLQRAPKGFVQGIDYSSVSVAKSSKVNAKAIVEGRCKVQEANVAQLPFGEGAFDLITAFETIYFWPDIEQCFGEVRKVLKPGAKFVIINEADGTAASDAKWESIIDGMHTYKLDEIRLHLTNAGFHHIEAKRNEAKHWLMVTATK